MRATINSIGAFSAGRFAAAICGSLSLVSIVFGLLLGVRFRIPGYLDSDTGLLGRTAWYIGRAATMVLAIGLSVLGYAVYGLLCGALAALIYNFIAKRFGGIEVEVEPAPDLRLEKRSQP